MATNKFSRDAMDMVVLNGCSTASGDNRAALGLAGLTIKSGVKSVVGTLWQVNDEAAMILMTEFYKNLNKNMAKSAAMRLAQLHMLKTQDNFTHPYYWSAFLVIGNWL
jgi:CHAT domain-containing protein